MAWPLYQYSIPCPYVIGWSLQNLNRFSRYEQKTFHDETMACFVVVIENKAKRFESWVMTHKMDILYFVQNDMQNSSDEMVAKYWKDKVIEKWKK